VTVLNASLAFALAASLVAAGSLQATCARGPARVGALLAPLGSDAAPGVTAMVLRGGAVVDSGSVGLADVERRIPITKRTAFDLASDAKQFTAMLAMILHQEGRLDYDAPVARFLPGLARLGPGMTVRHLLTHTSGLPDYYDALAGATRPGGFVTNADALAWLAREGATVFPPGEKFQYSDAGYEMLALVLERAAGKPFGDLLRERILAPLGMNDTYLRDRPDVAVPNRARGYTLRREGFVAEGNSPLDCLVGSGALDTTLGDLARWDAALAGHVLVSEATVADALRPAALNDGSAVPYAFGWYLKYDGGHRRLEHPGAWGGYQAFIVRYPDDRLTVVLLANRSDLNLSDLADRILAGAGLR
jgi:CubicO group peptidase (beta-lactamase class C family)